MPAGSLLEVTRHPTPLTLELWNSRRGPTAVNSFPVMNCSLTQHSPATGVMELWMRSYSSELFPNRELFLDTTLSCIWHYGTLDEVLQK